MIKLLKFICGSATGFTLGFGVGMFLYLGLAITPEEMQEQYSRFLLIEQNKTDGYYLNTWVDTETSVQYWQMNQYGLCPVLDTDGKPILWEQ